jgi:hypothetical protein
MIQTKILDFIDWLFNSKDNNKSTKSIEWWYQNNKLFYCRK